MIYAICSLAGIYLGWKIHKYIIRYALKREVLEAEKSLENALNNIPTKIVISLYKDVDRAELSNLITTFDGSKQDSLKN